ncbi:MAG: PaaI family thioesterase [Deltaproteobacteria bacterium]|nr:PaaI family thioesterase [Deltaproteobacteria bacterium]MBW2306318.1 PaaI family thioesterase [Deltaproteobacteria bacterium]
MNEKVFQTLRRRGEDEPFARHLGIRVLEVGKGYALVEMRLEPHNANIFGRPHGGAIFSLVDEAFEMAGNSHGTVAVALNMNITYIASPSLGAVLQAEAREQSRSRRTAAYEIRVREDQGRLIAICQALVYRKDDKISFLEQP